MYMYKNVYKYMDMQGEKTKNGDRETCTYMYRHKEGGRKFYGGHYLLVCSRPFVKLSNIF